MNPIGQTGHRPWPLPGRPWVMKQTWRDLLFAHWPLPPASLQPLLPNGLELDLRDGQAWISVVPFHMTGIRLRWLPPLPGTSRFIELNVRTYVKAGGKAGVYFFSLDANHRLAVKAARAVYHLPYRFADMNIVREGESFRYGSVRREPHPSNGGASFEGAYRPVSEPYEAERGSLEHWLTERYCLFSADPHGGLHIGHIHHLPWMLQRAEADIRRNTMTEPLGVGLPGAPALLTYTARLDVLVWPLSPIR
ncbi:YqjF family protein [Paenibacillus sp. MBLB4367]|uniref:YqjF family protein n=1 Tax=Paenibacillus sp. MBLB4367 TaxID=3384767 RepID=UPI0039083071